MAHIKLLPHHLPAFSAALREAIGVPDDNATLSMIYRDGGVEVPDEWAEVALAIDMSSLPTPDDLSRQAAVRGIAAFAAETRTKVSGGADLRAIAAWSRKAARAERVLSGAGSDADLAALNAEAASRGRNETAEELASRQAELASWYDQAIAIIDGIEDRLTAAIATVPIDDLDAMLAAERQAAETQISDHMDVRPDGAGTAS